MGVRREGSLVCRVGLLLFDIVMLLDIVLYNLLDCGLVVYYLRERHMILQYQIGR